MSVLEAIAAAKTRDDVVPAYAKRIGERGPQADWLAINQAIIDRWSLTALRYIKEKAWLRLGSSRPVDGEGDDT